MLPMWDQRFTFSPSPLSVLLLSSLGSNWQWHQINNFTFFGLLSVCGSLLRWYWLGEGELWKLIVSLVTRIKGKRSEKNRRQIKKGSEVERKASKKGPVKCSCKCVASMLKQTLCEQAFTHSYKSAKRLIYLHFCMCICLCFKAGSLFSLSCFHVLLCCSLIN